MYMMLYFYGSSWFGRTSYTCLMESEEVPTERLLLYTPYGRIGARLCL